MLYPIYLIVNPFIWVSFMIQSRRGETDKIFTDIYILFLECLLSIYCLIKIFWKSNDKEILEAFSEFTIEEDDEEFYNNNLIFSFIALSLVVFLTPILGTITSVTLPFKPHWISLTNQLTTSKILALTISLTIAACSSISLTYFIVDWYISIVIRTALIYEFNKLTKEAERYIKEKPLDAWYFFKNYKEIKDICITHDTLSKTLNLVNKSFRSSSGIITLVSIPGFCVATYLIINDSFEKAISEDLFALCTIVTNLMLLILIIWNGLNLNKAVSHVVIYNRIFL